MEDKPCHGKYRHILLRTVLNERCWRNTDRLQIQHDHIRLNRQSELITDSLQPRCGSLCHRMYVGEPRQGLVMSGMGSRSDHTMLPCPASAHLADTFSTVDKLYTTDDNTSQQSADAFGKTERHALAACGILLYVDTLADDSVEHTCGIEVHRNRLLTL